MTAGADERIEQEATDWFARLNQRAVTAETVRDFDRWRRTPAHAAAFARVDSLWRASGALAGDPDIAAAIGDALPRRKAKSPSWRLGLALAAALILCASAVVFYLVRPPAYETRIGEQRVLQLADGSTIRLNTDSRAVVRYSDARRDIELVRGQAFFDVAHDAARPFVVRAGGVEVRALGTRFDVRRQSAGALVTLVEGRVEVKGREQVVLEPGEQARGGDDASPTVARADLAAATAWTHGKIVLRDIPLGDALAEINRYSNVEVALADGTPRAVRVSGVFDTGDTDAFVTAVTTLLPLEADRSTPDKVVLRAS